MGITRSPFRQDKSTDEETYPWGSSKNRKGQIFGDFTLTKKDDEDDKDDKDKKTTDILGRTIDFDDDYIYKSPEFRKAIVRAGGTDFSTETETGRKNLEIANRMLNLEGPLDFEDFFEILRGPNQRGEEQQENTFGFKKVYVESEDKSFYDLESYVSHMLNKYHRGKVIDGFTFEFEPTGSGDKLLIKKFDATGNEVDEVTIPLMLESNLSTQTQYEEYVKFLNPNFDAEKFKEEVSNEFLEQTEKYIRNNKDFWSQVMKHENETYYDFIKRIEPKSWNTSTPGMVDGRSDGSTFESEGTQIGDYIKVRERTVYSRQKMRPNAPWKYYYKNEFGQRVESPEAKERYYILQEIYKRKEISEELWSNMVGGPKDKKDVKGAIKEQTDLLFKYEELGFSTEGDFENFLKIAKGADGKWNTEDDVKGWQKILVEMPKDKNWKFYRTGLEDPEIAEMPGMEETLEWFYSDEREDAMMANIISEFTEKYVPIELANFEKQHEEEIEKIVSENEIEVKTKVNKTFGKDLDLIEKDYADLQDRWGNQKFNIEPSKEVKDMFQDLYLKARKDVEKEIQQGTRKLEGIDAINEEALNRANNELNLIKQGEWEALANKHKSKLDEIEAFQQNLIDELSKELNDKYQDAFDLYLNGDKEKGITGVMEKYYDQISNASGYYDNLIDDEAWVMIGNKMKSMNFHRVGTSYETKKLIINSIWSDYKQTLSSDISKEELANHKKEFLFRLGKEINFRSDGGVSRNAIITEARAIKEELEAEGVDRFDFGDERTKLLRIVTDIVNEPENFSKWGVNNFFRGLSSKRVEYWIPIAGDIIDAYRQSEIRDIINKNPEERSETENSIMSMYVGLNQIQQSLQNKSTGYTVGQGTIDTLKFMAEMIISRYTLVPGFVGKASRFGFIKKADDAFSALKRTNNTLKGYTRSQRAGAGYSQFKYGSMVVTEKAIKTWETAWNTLGQTFVGGGGRIAKEYQMRMTPEMAYAVTPSGEAMIDKVMELGYYNYETKSYEKSPGGPEEIFFKSTSTVYTDFITEKMGAALPYLGKIFKENPGMFHQVVLGKYLKKIGFNPATQDMFQEIKKAGGYNGMLAEVFEEIVAQPIHNWIDGKNYNEGMDWETFYKPVILQTAIFQVSFMGGNKVYKMGKGITDPSYQADGIAFSSAENLEAYIRKTIIDNGGVLPEGFEIKIDNDFAGLKQINNILKNKEINPNNIEVQSENLQAEVISKSTELEIEATNQLSEEQNKELEEDTEQVENLKEENKKLQEEIDNLDSEGRGTENITFSERTDAGSDTYVMPGAEGTTSSYTQNTKEKQDLIDKIKANNEKIKGLNKKKKDLLQPIIEKLNKKRSTPKYKELIKKVRNFVAKLDPDTRILEMRDDNEMEMFAKANELEKRYGSQFVKREVDENGNAVYTSTIDGNRITDQETIDKLNKIEAEVDLWAKQQDFGATHAYFDNNVDGNPYIVINKDATIKLGADNAAAHEVLHRFLNKTFENHPHIQLAIGQSLQTYLLNLNPKDIENSDLRKRIIGYQQAAGDIVAAEETLNLFSDALVNGEIKLKETVMTKIGDFFRRAFLAAGVRVEFGNANDVVAFIKDYNRAVEKGKFSRGLKRTMELGAKITGSAKAGSDNYIDYLRDLGWQQNSDGSFETARDQEGNIQFSTEQDLDMFADEELFTPEMLIEVIKSPSSSPAQISRAEAELTKQFDLLALNAIKYDTRAGTIPRENVISAARVELPGIIKRFDPTTSKFSTYVTNSMRPKAQQIYEEAKTMDFETTSLDSPLVQQLADPDVSGSSKRKKDDDKEVIKTDVLKFDRVSTKVGEIKSKIKVKKGDTFKEISDKHTGEVGEIIFDVPSQKIIDPKKNLTYAKKIKDGVPEPSEAGNIQQFYSGNNLDKAIRILPPFNVSSSDADINKVGENIDVSRDVLGRSLGLNNKMLNYFYEKVIGPDGKQVRSKGKTSQVGMWKLKSEFKNPTKEVIDQTRVDLGITPRGELNKYDRGIGQLLKGFAKFQSQQTALSAAQRILEQRKADKQQIANITAAQSKLAFSKQIIDVVENTDFNSEFAIEKTLNGILDMFGVGSVYELNTEKQIDEFEKAVKKHVLPLMPRDFWFGQPAFIATDVIQKEIKRFGDRFYEIYNLDINTAKPLLEKAIAKPHLDVKKRDNKVLKNTIRDLNIQTWGTEFTPGTRSKAKNSEIYKNYYKPKMEALRNLPDEAFGAPVEGVKDFSRVSYGTIFKDEKTIKTNIKNGSIEEFNNKVGKIHKALWSRINSAIKNDKQAARAIGNYLKLTAKQSNHWHKLGAQFEGWSPNPVGKYRKGKLVPYEFEHAMPATAAYLYLMHTSLGESNFDAAYAAVMDNYKLIALDANQNEKLNAAGYARNMPDNWDLRENFWWQRYFNEKVFAVDGIGIDPNNIIHISGKTFAQQFNINAEGKTPIIKTKVASNLKQSRAILNSRQINLDTPSRDMSAWDFDDTLATTKSGVRATIPNPDGTPQPNRKVIFLAGGAGSGKSNVVKKLGLEEQGFKIVNSDISLEWLKKNSGLPENMNDLTKEQLSKLGSLQAESRKIARRKMMKYQGNADGVVIDGTGGSIKAMTKLVNEFKDKGYDVSMVFVETSLETALERNRNRKERSLLDKIVIRNHEAVQGNKEGFKEMFGERFMEVKTDNLTQKDPMPTDLVSKMDDFVTSYKKVRLDAEEFATQGADILEQGGEFDFSEFNVVTEGAPGPMFKTAFDRAQKYGTKDTYVLTARPAASEKPIHEFLKSQGLNIPLENITGLGNSTGEAKAEWMLEKFSEGYNNMYFADDAIQNVKAVKDVLDQLDIKSKVVQAKIKFSKDIKDLADEILTDPAINKSKKQISINGVKDIDLLTSPENYSNIKFSKKHRGEYENLISKRRPDLVEAGLVTTSVDMMFDLVDGLNVPIAKKRKYEQIMTKWLATSVMKLPEDNYKLQEAVELAEKYKEDIFAYSNPNQIIEKYAGKPKGPINPDTVELFVKNESKTNEKYGITEYVVEETKESQAIVRKVVDTHWGPKSNPWCIIARDKNGSMDAAWNNWERYSDGPKRIVFQNGKLLAFYASNQYWDRMDNATDEPVVNIKKGRVTEKAELVPIGGGKYQEFVLETRTVSKDGNTVETLYNQRREYDGVYEHEAGTRKVENKVNGQTVKESIYRPAGDLKKETSFKDGKAVETRSVFKGRTSSINVTQGLEVSKNGDRIQHEITEGNIDYWWGQSYFKHHGVDLISEIGFQTKKGFEVMDVMERVDGKLRLDLSKIVKIDPNIKGVPSNIKFSKEIDLDVDINQIIEESTGVRAETRYSDAQAKIQGAKFKFTGLVPPSAQDFAGLLYSFLARGKKGEEQFEKLKKALIDPFSRGIDELNTAKQNAALDLNALLKEFPEVKKDLNKRLNEYEGYKNIQFTVDQAIRVYLWDKAGFEVPGLSQRDLKALTDFVSTDVELTRFAEALSIISKKPEGYSQPSEYWLAENIKSDLLSDGSLGDARADFLSEWQANVDIIFSKENLNKIQAIYGNKFREALEDVLERMRTGLNRRSGSNRLLNEYMNWVNGSIGAIMFFNVRSAVLQTISATNYINWSDNNPLKAAAAFANQVQYWKDFGMLFNSNYLKQRRAGNQRGINEAELSRVVVGVTPVDQAKAVIRYLLKIGFTPTQIADSFAISAGGASFYRNRVNTYLKQGFDQKTAEEKAFLDFQETTEVSQQSARPDMISQQQANPLGRLILAFANTPMQYGRIMDKSFRDIINRRGDTKTHVSKIIYYGVIQGIIFTALQQALFAALGEDDEDEKQEIIDKKKSRMLNSMVDTWLTTFGYGGKAISTIKNTIMEYNKQRAKDLDENFMTKSDHAYTLLQALSFSPPIGSKARKIYQSTQAEKFNRNVIKERGFTLDNPVWGAIGNVIEGATNIPFGRLSNKMLNLDNAMDSQHETWKRLALILGWNTWDLNIEDPDLVALDADIKERKKIEKEQKKTKKKYEEKKKKLIEENPNLDEEQINIKIESQKYYPLRKYEQIEILKKLDVSDKEIKELKKESDRAEKIHELYKGNEKIIDDYLQKSESKSKEQKDKEEELLKTKKKKKEKVKLSKSQKREKDLFKMKKKDQINLLLELGYSPRKINSLKYEKDRVKMIMELESK